MAESEIGKTSTMDRIYREAHMIRYEDLFCRKCVRYFDSNSEFSEHVKKHINETNDVKESYMTYIEKHVCSMCGKAFEVKSDLIIHYNTVCFDAPYTCKHCKKNCKSSAFLQVHLLFHHNYTEKMLRDAGLLTDINNVPSVSGHSVLKSFRRKAFLPPSSEETSKSYDFDNTLTNRKSRGTGGKRKNLAFNMLDKVYICEICHQSFSRKCVLDIHVQKHSWKRTRKKRSVRNTSENFSTMVCTENSFIFDINTIQESKNNDLAPGTAQYFDRKKAILQPSNVILGSTIWKKVEPKSRVRNLKIVASTRSLKRKCKSKGISDTTQRSSSRLKGTSQRSDEAVKLSKWKNVKLSSRLRNFATSDAKKSSESLNVRMKSKPRKCKRSKKKNENREKQMFVCELCKRAFTDSYKLRRHFLIHTGERPYSCLKCKKTFARDDHLKRHMVKVCSKTGKSK